MLTVMMARVSHDCHDDDDDDVDIDADCGSWLWKCGG